MTARLFEAAFERTAKTWKTYVTAIVILHLTLTIDIMSGGSFLAGKEPINLGGFKVVREALSATYGILFSVFVAAAYLESRLLGKNAGRSSGATVARPAAADLWFVSPFSGFGVLRFLFWALFVDGFIMLAIFSVIHLALVGPPRSDTISNFWYRIIGVVDLSLLIICLPFAVRTYANLRDVRARLATGLTKIISGGQTGVDQAALRAALDCRLEIGGWCPPGRECEAGTIPEAFPLKETPSDRSAEAPDIPRSQRTEWNVCDADGTLVVRSAGESDAGTDWTIECARRYERLLLICDIDDPDAMEKIKRWLAANPISTLNVAGPSESTSPGIGDKTYALLRRAFAL